MGVACNLTNLLGNGSRNKSLLLVRTLLPTSNLSSFCLLEALANDTVDDELWDPRVSVTGFDNSQISFDIDHAF